MSKELDYLLAELGSVYDTFKDFETKLKGKTGKNPVPGLKEKFFDEATKAQTATLAQKTVRIGAAECDEEPEAYVAKRYPRWVIKDTTYYDGTQDYDVLIEENPEFKPFSYVHQASKRVWTKQVVDGTPWIDDEELQAQDPELWDEVSDIPNYDILTKIFRRFYYDQNLDPNESEGDVEYFWRLFDGPREMKPLDDLDSEQLAKVQRYIYPGKPIVKLAAPRKAKPEELSDE